MRLYRECPVCDRKDPFLRDGTRVHVYGCEYGGGVKGCDSCGYPSHCNYCDDMEELACFGYICTQAEWDEQEKRQAQEREEGKNKARQLKYEEALKKLPVNVSIVLQNKEKYSGEVSSGAFYFKHQPLDLKKVESIFVPENHNGIGIIIMKNSRNLMFDSYPVDQIIPPQTYDHFIYDDSYRINRRALYGEITLRGQKNSYVKVGVKELSLLVCHTPTMEDVLGRES